jgi:uncharacterized membrane protein
MDSLALAYELPIRKKVARERVFEIDFLRGFDILLMVLLHFCYDLSAINAFFKAPASGSLPWVKGMISFGGTIFQLIDFGELFSLEFFFSGLFMFLSGISCSFSHSNFTRGIKLSFVAVLMTLALECADHFTGLDVHIYLGILHSLAIAMLLYSFVDHFWKSYWVDYGVGIAFTIALGLTLYYSDCAVYYDYPVTNLPKDGWKLLLGLGHAGDDYFSPLLTCTLMFLGAVVGKTLYRKRQPLTPAWFPKKWANPILFLGQHSLEAYILHQPLSILALWIILAPFGYRLG